MRNFDMNSLREWRQVAVGELLAFEVPTAGSRSVQFQVIADGTVSVRAVAGEDAWLVAYGDGLMTVKFTVQQDVGVLFLGDGDPDIFVKLATETQVIPESRDPSFTSIEPRRAGPSDEVRQMMHIMRINAARREEQLRQQYEALSAQLAKQAPSPAPAPVPAPESEVIEGEGDASV